MGTYIMLHIEYRLKSGGEWKHVNFDSSFMTRGYSPLCAFLGLGGVEGHLPLRGLPEDITIDTRESIFHDEDYMDLDYYNYSWASSEEIESAVELAYDVMQTQEDVKGNLRVLDEYLEWKGFIGYMKSMESSMRYECRAIYWFF